jgi:acetate kinase
VRAKTLEQLSILGFQVDENHNTQHGRQSRGVITTNNSTVALVVATDEEAMIAQDTIELVS